ncbi:MAG: DMT family transporter [Saprospiraceae bacterium]
MEQHSSSFTRSQELFAAGIVFIGAISFSTKAVIVKLAYRYGIDSLSLLTLRMLFSLPFFLVIGYLYQRWRKPNQNTSVKISRKDWKSIIGLGLAGYYLASYFDFEGLQYITASLERLILFVYPTLVVLISALFFRKKITRPQLFALVLTYIGIGCAFIDKTAAGQSENLTLGAIFVFGSALSYAIYLVGSGQLIPRLGSIRYTSYVMTVACLAVISHNAVLYQLQVFTFPWEVYALALLMAVIATVLPSFLVSEGIRVIGSSNASIIGSVGPISTIILAYIFLDEQLGWLQIAGTVLVIGGVLIIALQKKE